MKHHNKKKVTLGNFIEALFTLSKNKKRATKTAHRMFNTGMVRFAGR